MLIKTIMITHICIFMGTVIYCSDINKYVFGLCKGIPEVNCTCSGIYENLVFSQSTIYFRTKNINLNGVTYIDGSSTVVSPYPFTSTFHALLHLEQTFKDIKED